MDNYQDEESAIARRQRIAEMLMAQGAEPLDTNQVAGGYVVPISPLAGIAKVAQQIGGAYIGRKADERAAKMEQDRANALVGVDFNAPDAPAQLARSGYTKEAVTLAMQRAKGGDNATHLVNTQVLYRNGKPVVVGFNSDASTKEFADYDPMIQQKTVDTGSEILQVPAKAPWGMRQQPTAPAAQPMPQSATVTSPTGEVRNYSRKQIEFGLAAHGTKEGLVQYLREGGQLPQDQEIDAINGRNQAQGMPIQGQTSIKKELPPNQTLDYLGQVEAAKSSARLPYDIERKQQEAAIATSAKEKEISQSPLPIPALKLAQEYRDDIANASSIGSDLGTLKLLLESGNLNLGPIDNLKNEVRLYTNSKDPEAANYGTFKTTIEKVRNDSLRLNKGVQTDEDAKRAWNEIFSNINNKDYVIKRLGEIQKINERGATLKANLLGEVYTNYGKQPPDVSKFMTQPSAIDGDAVNINSDEEYNALPSGAEFISPDGKRRRKP